MHIIMVPIDSTLQKSVSSIGAFLCKEFNELIEYIVYNYIDKNDKI